MSRLKIFTTSIARTAIFMAGIMSLAVTGAANAKNGSHGDHGNGNAANSPSPGRITHPIIVVGKGDHKGKKDDARAGDREGSSKHAVKDERKSGQAEAKPTQTKSDKLPVQSAADKKPAQSTAEKQPPGADRQPPQSTAGMLPPHDPVGNTHPAPPPIGVVTVSNGVTKYDIQNGPGGVAVYSGSPGTITVTNGTESKTLSGGSLTLSGNVVGVGAAQGIQVGPRNGEGSTVVAISPPPSAPAKPLSSPVDTSLTGQIKDGVKDLGHDAVSVGKAIGNGAEDLALDFFNLGGPSKK